MPERAPRTAQRTARTVLAFDFGLKRIGVAVGEPELRTAHPLPAIAAPGFDAISRLVAQWKPEGLVVGLPVAEQGEHPLARRVERFARQLEGRYRLPVTRVDERYSSVEAEARLRGTGAKKSAIDSVAAQLILEQYFDERQAA
jgi:putative Holliday junction resolvase